MAGIGLWRAQTMEEIKFGLITGLIVAGFVSLWDFKLESIVKQNLRQRLDKESKEVTSIFIDPRRE